MPCLIDGHCASHLKKLGFKPQLVTVRIFCPNLKLCTPYRDRDDNLCWDGKDRRVVDRRMAAAMAAAGPDPPLSFNLSARLARAYDWDRYAPWQEEVYGKPAG